MTQSNGKNYIFLIIIIFCFSPALLNARFQEELGFIINNNPIIQKEKIPAQYFKRETSELKIAALGLIRFYQFFISSQHNEKTICTFTPSCSKFGYKAIKKYGIMHGILMTSDRILRCHGLGSKFYPIDIKTGKYIDPVYFYYLGPDK